MKTIYGMFAAGGMLGVIAFFVLWIGVIVGWVINIVKLIGMIGDPQITVLLVVRIVGVFAPPVGAIVGWFF